ncbi:hypothetical protein I4U23_019941 [Adineta vaga]|nr:hypothetical protein I4U23_019941 [Adineta vaga]
MTHLSIEVRNYFKLELLLERSHIILRQLFKNRYSLFNSRNLWDDTTTCGINYLTNVITKNKQINLTPVQKTSISSGNSDEWDLSTLIVLLLFTDRPNTLNTAEIQILDNEDTLLKLLRDIRNKIAHHASKSIVDVEFNQLWNDLSSILIVLGEDNNELKKLKDDTLLELANETVNEENVEKARQLNSLGTQAHKDGKFVDAIAFFTKATELSDVSQHDRAFFYSNMSASHLELYEQSLSSSGRLEVQDSTDHRYRALQDAKQARTLWPTWWRGQFRVGKAYAVLNEHEKAINSYERAIALDPVNANIQKAMDESRQIYGRQSRQEHLDPRLKPRTMPELYDDLQDNFGINTQSIRSAHNIVEKIDPATADATKGHKYEHGDINVKQNYEQAAAYFAKAANQNNAEGLYNLARLTDRGLGVEKNPNLALKLFEQAAAQPPMHPRVKGARNIGVAEAEHALGLRYYQGITVHKHLPTAAYWYQRATDHGGAESANNLAIMYEDGIGVDRNLEKAEQLFELSSRRGDPNAMLSLANLLLNKNDFQMAKAWHDRACEAGNILAQTKRHVFDKTLQNTQKLMDQCSPVMLQNINAIKSITQSLKQVKSIYRQSDKTRIYDYDVLNEHALRGSITAKKMCTALEHFGRALYILMQNEVLNENEENIFVYELAQCYRIEHIVAQIPGIEFQQRIVNIVDRVLDRCDKTSNVNISQVDEDARLCYAILHMDSRELVLQFLNVCKQKYPKSVLFYDLSAALNGWLSHYEASLYEANAGLAISSNNEELLYSKAVALRLLDSSADEAVDAYQVFLEYAPKDHRKVPESYYAMASCQFVRRKQHRMTDVIKEIYQKGEEAEKLQLPCFLPYQSNSKILLKPLFDTRLLINAQSTSPSNRKVRLTNPHRIEVITEHREWESRMSRELNNPAYNLLFFSDKPRVTQQTAKSLIGLQSISLRQLDPRKDHVYTGYVLSITIIDEAYSWIPSIHLVIEDEHLSCERLFIYGFSEDHGEYLTKELFTIGSKMHIINPYLRIGANDMKSLIRVDDFSSIIMQNENERVINMCRCCGEPNALNSCGRCLKARYCSKDCQTLDWKSYKHKLICKK